MKPIKNCGMKEAAGLQTGGGEPADARGVAVKCVWPVARLAGAVRSLLFFTLFYLYVWLVVDLRLIYHHNSATIVGFPVFFRDWAFFRWFLSYPGGPVEYLSSLPAQLFYIGWAGALVVTLQAALLSMFTDSIIKTTGSPHLRILRYIPPILLLSAYTQYTFYFVTTMALLVSLAFAVLYLKLTSNNKPVRFVAYAAGLVIVYTIAGGAYLLYAALCVMYELICKRRWQPGLLYVLSAAAVPYLEGVLLFNVSIAETFNNVLPFYPGTLYYRPNTRMVEIAYALYLFLPLIILASGLWRMFSGRRRTSSGSPSTPGTESNSVTAVQADEQDLKSEVTAHIPMSCAGRVAGWLIETVILFAVAGTTVFLSYSSQVRTLFAVDYFARQEMWPDVLRTARRHPSSNSFVAYMVNQALYHTGRLPYDMFGYPQNHDSLFLTRFRKVIDWKKYDVYFDMGQMNLAEHGLCEAMERFGMRPAILKRLALINMVKGKNPIARIYLTKLSKTLFYDDWANNYLARLQADPNLSTDEHIQRLRTLMVAEDKDQYFGIQSPPEQNLLALLDKNRQNQMAFEYLMAYYLLTGQLDSFVENLYRLDDFDYPEIPRVYEEVILFYESLKKKEVDLRGRKVSAESHLRFSGFSQVYLGRYAAKKGLALKELAKDYGDSYFFYYIYGYSIPKR